jgi:NAD(P)H-dependent FMN reductase
MLRVGIIIGSIRPNRVGESVARWVYEQLQTRNDAIFELVDLRDFNLPLLDEPVPAGMSSNYTKEHTRIWSAKVNSFDAFIFVTPEYNHGFAASLKNALDFLYKEWNNKAAGMIGYGAVGGTRVVEMMRITLAELQVATIRTQLAFNFRTDFENMKTFKPGDYHKKTLKTFTDQLLLWGEAMRRIRTGEITVEEEVTPSKDQSWNSSSSAHPH